MSPDPAEDRDLSTIPNDDLKLWLRCERHVKNEFLNSPTGPDTKAAERARWASGRVKRIEGELGNRGQA